MNNIEQIKEDLKNSILNFSSKGWAPATSTNYSFRTDIQSGNFYVSKSGIDKTQFTINDFILVDLNGDPTDDFKGQKPSAETLIHCFIYQIFINTKVILHSHSVYSVLNSQKYKDLIHFKGYEIQKGFKGQKTHDNVVSIPIFDNSQNMNGFTQLLKNNQNLLKYHCFIIKNHGVYAWGENLFEAKRHLETLENLLEINWKLNH
jgi:methylthioribulose-1-phosphate dehydratase